MSDRILEDLFETIMSRKGASSEDSYVASLLNKGTAKITQKVGEEAIETCIEAVQGDNKALAAESADLLFHLMVLWADRGLVPSDVTCILQERMGISGHKEKANRSS